MKLRVGGLSLIVYLSLYFWTTTLTRGVGGARPGLVDRGAQVMMLHS